MKLIRAEFENFRLLRDLQLDFSADSEKKLTVIRGESGTGKTTILNALQWAFYGDNALPQKGKDYRLSPIEWNISDAKRIPISVQVDFETTNYRKIRTGDLIQTKTQYRIIRSAYETLDGIDHYRTASTVKLFELTTDIGFKPIEPPESVIHDILQPELREVFFIDGDKAPSFIETESVRVRRKYVHEAIRSLLGLDIIQKAIRHVKKTAFELNKEAKKIGSEVRLTEIATKLEQIDIEIGDLEKERNDAKLQFDVIDQKMSELDKDIEVALIIGDKEELNRELKQTKLQLEQTDKQLAEASKTHSNLFAGLSLFRDLLTPVLEKSLTKLNELRDQGAFFTIPIHILEELLTSPTCVCGETLDSHTSTGKHRREHLHSLIKERTKPDALQIVLANLYYASLPLHPEKTADNEHWSAEYAKIAIHRDELDKLREELAMKLKNIEVQLDNIPDTDIPELRTIKAKYIAHRDRFNADRVRYDIQLKMLKTQRTSLVAERNNLLSKQRRGIRTLTRLEVTCDIQQILDNSYNRIVNQELVEVIDLMNRLFLEMSGENSVIQRAEISKEFDILVYGFNNVPLNLKHIDSLARRVLPLAFILALTQMSDAEAPNVIDTPFGLMSGYDKRSFLRTTLRESSQLILFLTRSEIRDCEDIIDSEAGRVITLTNPAHYPRMLTNDPQVKELNILRCECNHRQECKICMLRTTRNV